MPLRLQLIAVPSAPVDLGGILPAATREATLGAVEHVPIWHGNRRLPLAELFRVSGAGDDQRIELEGDLAGVHRVGAKLDAGEMHVEGNVGRHAGEEMSGGSLRIDGDAGDWAGAAISGGTLHIDRSAGDHLGGVLPGAARGMTGGTILVSGDVGCQAGARMRRGLIAVGGAAGEWAALEMLAGSLVVFGACGKRPGAGMRRGTLVLAHGQAPELLPTFRWACRSRSPVVGLLIRTLRAAGFSTPDRLDEAEFDLYSGDMLHAGRGEILTRAS